MIENFQKFYGQLQKSHAVKDYDNEVSRKKITAKFISKTTKTEEGIFLPVYEEIKLNSQSINLSTESLCFLAHLNGHNKNLLYFLLLYFLFKTIPRGEMVIRRLYAYNHFSQLAPTAS